MIIREFVSSADKITQKIAIHLPEDQPLMIIQSVDSSHIFVRKSDGDKNESKRSKLSSVFLRQYKNTFPNDL